jgi:flagellar biogenesis protein FliO
MPNLRAPAFERACPAVRTCCQKLWRLAATLTGSKPKVLFVRESAALGDRRFISVIQFERSRFLIGSSPASVTLLAQLPDASASLGETTNAIHREGC